jgi:hypothetical protein
MTYVECSDIGGASIKILKTDFADQITSPESADLLALYAEPNLGEELDWNVPQRSMYYSNHNSLQYPSTHSTFYPIPLQTEMTQKPILLNYSSQYKMDEIPKRLSADNHFISNPLYSTSIHSSDDPKGSRRHSDTAHAPNGQFKCPRPTCKHHTDGGFRRKGNLIRHIRRFHEAYGSEEPFETNRANDPTEKPLESNQMEA